MICVKCGKEIQDGLNFCTYCKAVQTNKSVKNKKIALMVLFAVVIAAAIIGLLSFTGVLDMSDSSGLSGTWYDVSERDGRIYFTITLNSDGTGILYEYEDSSPYAFTYKRNDDGAYVTSNITTLRIWGAWIIRKDGKDLLISGDGIGKNERFTKSKVNDKTVLQANTETDTPLFEVKKAGNGVKITGYVGDYEDGVITIPETIGGLTVKEIGDYAFVDKSFLGGPPITSIIIPDSVVKIGDCAFEGCKSLKSVVLPEELTSIGDRAFNFCVSLESVSIPESVTEIGNCAFGSCMSLTSINIPSAVKKINPSTFGYCTNLKQLTLPDELTEIGSYAFCECGITELIIPDTVTKIGEGAFSESGLTSITIPPNVKEIEKYTFRQNDLPTIEVTFTGGLSWLCMDAFDKNSTVYYKDKLYNVDYLYWVVNGEPVNQAFS